MLTGLRTTVIAVEIVGMVLASTAMSFLYVKGEEIKKADG
jgi:hypothetical protein